ncbi:MAG: heme ABC transporter ATP-binding protein [Anaerolineales bacterium]
MLYANSLTVSYGKLEVLRNLDIEILSGMLLGVIGPNGSGKTTLIRALSGVIEHTLGSVQLSGKELAEFSEAERARHIAVVPQSASLPPAFTVFECVALGRTPHLNWLGRLGSHDLDQIQRAMHACEISHLAERRAAELSGGEQQRVLLARALAQDCPILLLDEPTAHLDLHHQVALLNLMRRMAKENSLAVLVAMHDLNLAALYADQLVLLVNGRVRASGSPAEVLTADILQEAYRVPLQVHPNPRHGMPWIVL